MADEVTKKDFDALVKKVNYKFAEIDKWQKAEEGYRKTIVDTSNEAVKTLHEAIKKLVDDMNKQEQFTIDSVNKALKVVNDNISKLDQRITKLEKSKLF